MDGVKSSAGAAPTGTRKGLSDGASASALFVVALACAGLLLSQERRIAPLHLPTLLLPAAPVETQLAADRARETVELSAAAQALDALLLEQGEAEAQGAEDTGAYKHRRKALLEQRRALVEREGSEMALALRARATARFVAALDLQLPEALARKVIGAMGSVFNREGVVLNGRMLAAPFVVRTLFKARWNLLHGLSPEYAMSQIEQRAFFGFQALHSSSQPLPRRLQALDAYGQHGGQDVEEARGVLLFRANDFAGAAAALELAYAKRPTIRLRNYLLGARWAAGFED